MLDAACAAFAEAGRAAHLALCAARARALRAAIERGVVATTEAASAGGDEAIESDDATRAAAVGLSDIFAAHASSRRKAGRAGSRVSTGVAPRPFGAPPATPPRRSRTPPRRAVSAEVSEAPLATTGELRAGDVVVVRPFAAHNLKLPDDGPFSLNKPARHRLAVEVSLRCNGDVPAAAATAAAASAAAPAAGSAAALAAAVSVSSDEPRAKSFAAIAMHGTVEWRGEALALMVTPAFAARMAKAAAHATARGASAKHRAAAGRANVVVRIVDADAHATGSAPFGEATLAAAPLGDGDAPEAVSLVRYVSGSGSADGGGSGGAPTLTRERGAVELVIEVVRRCGAGTVPFTVTAVASTADVPRNIDDTARAVAVATESAAVTAARELKLEADELARLLVTRLASVAPSDDASGGVTCDPRHLTFEFVTGFVLRSAQVGLRGSRTRDGTS